MGNKARPIVLASASPQRAALLEQLGLDFTAVAADIDETPRAGERAHALAERLAAAKAKAVASAYPRALVIGSDTVVALGDRLYGKPADTGAAKAMLQALSGTTHRVASGVAVAAGARIAARVRVSEVTVRALERDEIAAYVATGEPYGKAGAYAIQGRAALFVEHLAGSYSAVMGLPLFETAALLRAFGQSPLTGSYTGTEK